jgi:hypothetical protein
VTDTVACRAASVAYDAQLMDKHPTEPVVLLELGTKRLVVKKADDGGRFLNMLFDQTLGVLLNKFWL